MNSVIIFDASNGKTGKVRERLRAKGYAISWYIDGSIDKTMYYLPLNAVWKPGKEAKEALADIHEIISELNTAGENVKLERCIILNSTPWGGIIGSPSP